MKATKGVAAMSNSQGREEMKRRREKRLATPNDYLPIDEQPQHDAVSRPAFDAEAALARVNGNRELLRKMVGVFTMQWRKLWDEIAKAGQHRDGAALELTA